MQSSKKTINRKIFKINTKVKHLSPFVILFSYNVQRTFEVFYYTSTH